MKKNELIKRLKEIDRLLMEEVEGDELCDRAREQAHNSIEAAIDYLDENEDDGQW